MATRRYPAVTITAAILVIAGAGCADANDKRTEQAGSVDERATAMPSSTRPPEPATLRSTFAAVRLRWISFDWLASRSSIEGE